MNIKDKINNLISKIKSLKDDVVNFCKENVIKTAIFAMIFLIILLIILLITFFSKNKTEEVKEEQKIVFTQDLLIPSQMSKQYDYDISRKTKENWTAEETDKWFTIPTEDQIKQLSQENEKMINDLIGAAP